MAPACGDYWCVCEAASRIWAEVVCIKSLVTSVKLLGLCLRSGLALILLVLHGCLPAAVQPRPRVSGASCLHPPMYVTHCFDQGGGACPGLNSFSRKVAFVASALTSEFFS